MRIPRKHILEQRELINQLNSIKFVHYRDLISEIDKTNFHISTKVDFKAIEKKPEHKNIRETWGRLKHNTPHEYYYMSRKSSSKSEYIIDEHDNVYRFSDHWGAVASCEWTREGQGQLMMSVFESGDWEIGVANLSEFKVFRRTVERKSDFVINPKWLEEMENFFLPSW